MEIPSPQVIPSFKEALQFWWKLGWISFGGPAGQIAIMHRHVVEEKKWVSEDRFMHALNYCMLLPGPEAQQLATYLGWLLHGIRGGIIAGLLFILPSIFILIILSSLYVISGHIGWVGGLFDGLQPAVLAIILLAMQKIAKKAIKGKIHLSVAIFAWLAIAIFKIPFPLIIFGVILFGILHYSKSSEIVHEKKSNIFSRTNKQGIRKTMLTLGVAIACWVLPIIVIALATSGQEWLFWKNLVQFFTKAALVTFGGAYAVLPYVAQVAVEKYHWLSASQMIDGLALGETTPGPLIMVLAFVGFSASSSFYGTWWMGIPGLLVTTFYTFLPSFVFILTGAPWVQKMEGNLRWKNILGLVTAAVVGVLFNLALYFGRHILFEAKFNLADFNYFALGWTILSFWVLKKEKAGMITWILISAIAGVLWLQFRTLLG